jgi:prepilin-type N-terminal cleavage/methylation domain-containing protein/prepilin-type processing-associated H-X9-DG protein
MKHSRRPCVSNWGFTLVELLVVIGIVGLLVAILLPTLNKVRRQSQITKCLSNVRQLSQAVNAYVSEQRGYLPEAVYNNKTGLLSPKGRTQPAWAQSTLTIPVDGSSASASVLPSIGWALRGWTSKTGMGVWECPSGSREYNTGDFFQQGGEDPLNGFGADDVWLPNYFYMCTKVYLGLGTGSIKTSPSQQVKPGFNGTDWIVRNVAGLRANKARSVSAQGASDVVVFVEYKSLFHTVSKKDIYQLAPNEKTEYAGNYGFLDGHAETRSYKDRDGYMRNFHDPISQNWYGKEFSSLFAEFYDPVNFYR